MQLSDRRLEANIALSILVLLLVTLSACRQSPAVPEVSDATPSKPTDRALSTSTSIPVPTPSALATGTVAPDIQSPAAERASHPPTPTATWPAAGAQVPCGALLPILSSGLAPDSPSFDGRTAQLQLPEAAQPAFDRILSAPETVGLVAFELGRESDGVFLNPDVPMPLASVVKIINLIAYAQAAAAGDLDPAEWVALDVIDQTYLPRSDRGAHARAIEELAERRLIAFDPPATPLEEVPWMMIRHSSNAAADYLHLRLGQLAIEQTVLDLALESHTAPCPWIGQFLSMANSKTPTDNRRAVQAYIDDPQSYGQEAMRLTESYALDDAFRDTESEPGWRASFNTQTLFSENLNAQASARDYANLMSQILQNGLTNDYANILVRRALEWPMIFPANQELFTTIGLKDGSLPGVLTTAYYAQRIEDGASVVVVLFFRQLPRQTYRQWLRDLPNDEFARWLLSVPEAIPELRDALRVGD